LGSRSVFFLIMMGLITSQAVHGLVAEPSVDNRSLRTLPQRSSLLKLQVLGICCGLPTTGIFLFVYFLWHWCCKCFEENFNFEEILKVFCRKLKFYCHC
jgi:hypothetical protein